MPRLGSRVRVSFPAPSTFRSMAPARRRRRPTARAEWQSGHAAACKAVYAGSIPTSASTFPRRLHSRAAFLFCRLARPGGGTGRRSGLAGVPHGETRGCTGVKFGEPLTGRADGDPELSPCSAWESVETRRPLPKCRPASRRRAYGKGIVQTTMRAEARGSESYGGT